MQGPDRIEQLLGERRQAYLPPPTIRREIRARAGVTQGQLAQALGVSPPALSRWEAGTRTPRGEHRIEYAQALQALAASVGTE